MSVLRDTLIGEDDDRMSRLPDDILVAGSKQWRSSFRQYMHSHASSPSDRALQLFASVNVTDS